MFVVCCWGGRVVPLYKSMKQELFDIVFTSLMSFTISSCCNLGERVCSCLLLLGWKGCRLVYLFAVARVQGLAQSLFRRLGSSDPPFTSLTSPAWRLFIICSWGGSACSSANLGAKYLQKIMFSPFACCVFMCFPSYFILFYVVFLFPYSYKDERVVSWPVVLYLFI